MRTDLIKKFLDNKINSPQFPGAQFLNMDIDQIRDLIKVQRRAKGFRFTIGIGTTDVDLDLSGTAKVLLGFCFGGDASIPAISDSFSLVVNNEIIIQDGNTQFFSTGSQRTGSIEYFAFPRPLSGQDSISIRFQSTGAGTELMDIFYL